MAKILCGISGIEFSCDHLPIYLSSREYAHPIFFMPQKKLLGLYQKYRHGELPEIDSYLLFLAYLNSTDLVEWRVPAQFHANTASIVAQNFESLVNTVERMNRVKNPSVHFSHIAVSPDTKKLDNVDYWIASWEATYEDFTNGYVSQRLKQEIADLEERLDYLCKDANRSELQFASRLAVWADKAGSFPRFPVHIGAATIPCSMYWQQIIRKCTNAESIFSIPSQDLQELLDHCEENIDAGSTYAHHLFKILREGKAKQSNFLGLGDFQFSIISSDTSVEDANKLAIILNAPSSAPRRIDYPSEFKFLQAKLAYSLAQSKKEQEQATKTFTVNTIPDCPTLELNAEDETEVDVDVDVTDDSISDEGL